MFFFLLFFFSFLFFFFFLNNFGFNVKWDIFSNKQFSVIYFPFPLLYFNKKSTERKKIYILYVFRNCNNVALNYVSLSKGQTG